MMTTTEFRGVTYTHKPVAIRAALAFLRKLDAGNALDLYAAAADLLEAHAEGDAWQSLTAPEAATLAATMVSASPKESAPSPSTPS